MSLLSCSVNGENGSTISVQDRGLNYGDGVFETIALVNQKLIFWNLHYQRLLSGCNALGIPCPEESALKTEVERVIDTLVNKQNAVVKIIITRGNSERGYKAVEKSQTNTIVLLSEYPTYPSKYWLEGVHVKCCQTLLSTQKQLAGLKHLNRLEQVLARREWDDEFQEGLMLDETGHVIEGVMSNLFMVKNNLIITPPIDKSGVKGIMRNVVLNLCESNGIIAKQEHLNLKQLLDADEVFLTNSIIGIWPVSMMEKQSYFIGNVTKNLMQLLIKEYSINYATLSI